jgi:hypothetical protein
MDYNTSNGDGKLLHVFSHLRTSAELALSSMKPREKLGSYLRISSS